MERWKGRVALVTGASVGIGAAIARALVQHGMKVVGCSRSVDKIEKLAAECQSAGYSGTLVPYKCDLSNEEEILSMFSAIKTLHQGVDVCINNAGLAHAEALLCGKTEGWRNMIDVNVLALSICTREAYQSMKERNIDDGHIININSPHLEPVPVIQYIRHNVPPDIKSEPDMAVQYVTKRMEKAGAISGHGNHSCLKAEDIAIAVTYVLSAPPHVQVSIYIVALSEVSIS
ncbi:DHR11 reductase, partial [Polypterus senegalus]